MAEIIETTGWPKEQGPEAGDYLRVERTGELLRVIAASEDGAVLTVERTDGLTSGPPWPD